MAVVALEVAPVAGWTEVEAAAAAGRPGAPAGRLAGTPEAGWPAAAEG